MSWLWGGGNNNDDKKSSGSGHVETSTSFGHDATSSFDNSSSFGNDIGSHSIGGGSGSGLLGGPALGGNSFEQELMAEQQKAMIQAVMFKLTDVAFENCVTKPSTSLSSSEQSCISATVGKYLETTELIVGRFQGQQ